MREWTRWGWGVSIQEGMGFFVRGVVMVAAAAVVCYTGMASIGRNGLDDKWVTMKVRTPENDAVRAVWKSTVSYAFAGCNRNRKLDKLTTRRQKVSTRRAHHRTEAPKAPTAIHQVAISTRPCIRTDQR